MIFKTATKYLNGRKIHKVKEIENGAHKSL